MPTPKPDSKWQQTCYLFRQEEVAKALGIELTDNVHQTLRIECDGINKVRVEVWEAI